MVTGCVSESNVNLSQKNLSERCKIFRAPGPVSVPVGEVHRFDDQSDEHYTT